MKATEGVWLDFDGNPFGQGAGSSYVPEAGRYQAWRQDTGEPLGFDANEDYVVTYLDNYGDWNGLWNDIWSTHVTSLLCQKPAGIKFYMLKSIIILLSLVVNFR